MKANPLARAAIALVLVLFPAAVPVRSAFAGEPTQAQKAAEAEVVRFAEIAKQRYRQQRFLDEAIADANATRALEQAYGSLHPRVIEHLSKVVEKHGGHLAKRESVSLAVMLIDKVEALPGVPPEAIPGYRALITYSQFAVDMLSEPARPVVKRTLELMTQRLGREHSDVKTFRNYLFGSRLAEKPFDDAWDKLEKVYADFPEEFVNMALDVQGRSSVDEKSDAILNAAARRWGEILGPDHLLVAIIRKIQGQILTRRARFVEALPLSEEAVAIFERQRIPNPAIYSEILNNVAISYTAVGAVDKAEALLNRSLALLTPYQGELWHRNLALQHATASGQVQVLRRRYEDALALADRVIELTRDDTSGAGRFNLRQARLVRATALQGLKRHEDAIATYQVLLDLKPADDEEKLWKLAVSPWVNTLLAGSQIAAGQLDAAAKSLAAAESGMSRSSDFSQVTLLSTQANLASRTGNRAVAIFLGKVAVGHLQSIRGSVVNLDTGLERGFVSHTSDIYQFVADLLIEAGRLPEAQQMLALFKEDEYSDFAVRGQGTGSGGTVAFTGQEAGWEARYRGINGQIGTIAKELDTLRARSRRGDPLTAEESARRDRLDNDLKAARIAFDQYLADLMREFAKGGGERGLEVGEKNLESLRALQGTLKRLGHGAVAVHYLVTEGKVRILVTTPTVQVARESAIGSADLARKVQAFRRAVGRPDGDPRPLGAELHRLLLAPIQADLDQAGAGTLMVSLDGVLRYLPFAALRGEGGYLVERYRLAIYTEAARDKLKDGPAAEWRFAGMGLTRQVEGFSALPAVKEELGGIVKAGGRGVLPGEVHLDAEFDRARMRDALDRGFPVLHLASHFVFQPGTDVNSYLVLGDGSRLTLREIKESNLSFGDVDLITLSACDTANFGGRDANGREVEGLGTMLQKQGARSVIATLWPVHDESTGLFMREFYRLHEQQKLTKAEALRQAQVAFSGGKVKSDGAPRDFSHPFYWAPFILMGNWI